MGRAIRGVVKTIERRAGDGIVTSGAASNFVSQITFRELRERVAGIR